MSLPFKYLIVITFTAILTILTLGCPADEDGNIVLDKTQITGSISYQDIQVDYGTAASSTAKLTNITPSNATNSDYLYSINPPLPNGVALNPTNGTITVSNNAPGFSNTYLITATVIENDLQYKGSVTGSVSIKVNHFSGRTRHSVVEFNNELYIIGGLHYNNDVWKSSDSVTWTEVTAIQSKFSGRYDHSVVEFKNELYLIGGFNGNVELNDVWKSTDGVTWTEVNNNAQFSERSGHSVVEFKNELYLIGGNDGRVPLNDVWKSTDGVTWTEVNNNAQFSARYEHSVVEFNNELYLIGGSGVAYYNDVWKSSDGATWTEVTSTTPNIHFSARESHSAVVFNNELYLIGGYDGSDRLNDVWKSTDGVTWTEVNNNAQFSERSGHSVVVFNNELYLIGGYDGNVYLNDVWKSSSSIDWEQKL